MGLESTSTISGLNSSNPTSGDNVAQGDDHLRLIKTVLLADLVNNGTFASTGTMTLPNGVILKWSSASTNGSGLATFTYASAFPTAAWHAWTAQGSGSYAISTAAPSTTAATATLYVSNTGVAAGAGLPVRFLVIGN